MMGESYIFKIKHWFTEYGLGFLAKGAIFMSSVFVKNLTNLHMNNVTGQITQSCILPPLLDPAWIPFPWFSFY